MNAQKKLPSLSIFFPAYNEEANIARTIEQGLAAAAAVTDDFEVIVVDDGSSDKTREIARAFSESDERVRVIEHKENKGYGAALQSGIDAAKKEYVFFTDADLQFDLSELEKLAAHVPECEVVLGYRAKRQDPFMRLLNAKAWNLLNRALFGLKVRDIDCAFKLFKRDLAQRLPMRSHGAMFSAEFLIRLQEKGIAFREVPVAHLPRTAGSATGAKLSVIKKAFAEMLAFAKSSDGYEIFRASLLAQFSIFATIGVLNTLIDFGIYYFLTRRTDVFSYRNDTKYLANVVSFAIGTTFSFFANRRFTFQRKDAPSLNEAAKFYATTTSGLGVNTAILFVLNALFGINDLVAKVFSTAFSTVWNFTFKRLWVFSPQTKESAKEPVSSAEYEHKHA